MQIISSLVLILIIGIVTSISDIRRNIILNRDILIFLILGLGLNLIYGIHNFLSVVINSVLALLLGYVLYLVKIWAAGDAKLFVIYTLIVPISVYGNLFVPLFPAIILLTNIFVISSFKLFFSEIKLMRMRFDRQSIIEFSMILLSIFSFSWFIRKIVLIENSTASILLSYVISYLIYKVISKLIKKRKVILYSVLILGIFLRIVLTNILDGIWQLLIYSFVFFIISNLMVQNAKKKKIMNIGKLEPGMTIIEDNITLLTRENITDIKKRLFHKKSIEIKATIPLAPLMFASVLITVLIKGEVITYLWGILN